MRIYIYNSFYKSNKNKYSNNAKKFSGLKWKIN